jgi:uncharacterized membrane-anchored protein
MAPFELETHYFCGRWSSLLEAAATGPQRGEAGRAVRFLVAEARLRLGDTSGAIREFEQIESDPATRALQPFTSLVALSRVGSLSEAAGDTERAAKVYAELLTAWDGLDTPLEEQLDVQRRAAHLMSGAPSVTKPQNP